VVDFTTTPEGIVDYTYLCNGKVESILKAGEGITFGYDNFFRPVFLSYAGASEGLGYGEVVIREVC
jgi:hypothetical protein